MKINYWALSLFLFLVPSLGISHDNLLNEQGCHKSKIDNLLHCHHSSVSEVLYSSVKYSRNNFGGWIDEDQDCQNTRHELLQTLSISPTQLKKNGCLVIQGQWIDPYSGKLFLEAQEIDIDHLIPLKFAWDHGAFSWTSEKRIEFSNDPVNLLAVDRGLNRQKAAKGPSHWLPPNESFQCTYVTRFVKVAKIYKLIFSHIEQKDLSKLQNVLCK